MNVDESQMKEAPNILQRLKYSIIAVIFGNYLLILTNILVPIVFLPEILFYIILLLISGILAFLGWSYGDEFTGYLHTKIVNRFF